MATPAIPQDLQSIYDDLANRHQIPPLSDTYDVQQTVVQRMCVSLPALLEELKTKAPEGKAVAPRKLAIFCDLLRIDASAALPLSTHLMVFARRVEASGAGALALAKTSASLTLYAREWTGKLQLADASDPKWKMAIESIEGAGVSVRFRDAAWVKVDLPNLGMLREGPEMGRILEQSSTYAFLLAAEDHPGIADPILRHIKAATQGWVERQPLYLQSSALACEVAKRAGGGRFVPWLAKEVYDKQIAAFLESAGRFEDSYEAFRRDNVALKERAKYARMMLRNYGDMTKVAEQIRAQTQKNLDSAEASINYYREKINDQQIEIKHAELDFQHGVERYKEAKKKEMALEIAMAAISLGGAAASIAVGSPDPKAIDAVAKVAKSTGKVATYLAAMQKIADAFKKMAKFAEKLKKMTESIQKILKAAKSLKRISDVVPVLPDLPESGEDDGADDASWDIFRDQVGIMMQGALDEGIGGADEYKIALLTLAIYAKAMNQSQATLISLGQQLSIQVLQEGAALAQAQRMDEYIREMEKGQEPNEQVMRWLFERYLNVKRWLLLAIKNHNDAYRYWALQEPATQVSFSDSVAQLAELLGNIARGDAEALESMRGPQNFHAHTVEIDDPAAVAGFRQSGRIAVEVSPNHKSFRNRDRVRLKEVRVWLEGIQSKDPVQLSIATSGAYRDRRGSATFDFVTAGPLELSFEYIPPGKVLMEGGFASEYRAFYFEPG
jgi:hypothetical protein